MTDDMVPEFPRRKNQGQLGEIRHGSLFRIIPSSDNTNWNSIRLSECR